MTEGWVCAPSCPIRLLDEQTGDLSTCGGPKKTHGSGGLYEMGSAGAPGTIYRDSGGPSRFFKTFPPETEDNLIEPVQEVSSVQILRGDCVEVMREMPENSVDSVVTDPPYGIRFMGKAWDAPDIQKLTEATAAACEARPDFQAKRPKGGSSGFGNRAAKAGLYDQSLSANRKYQDWCEVWAQEALRVLKPGGYLLASGGTRTVHRLACAIEDAGFEIRDTIQWIYGSGFPKSAKVIPNLTPRQKQVRAAHGLIPKAGLETQQRWGGFGSAVKPSHEPVVVARRPLSEKSLRAQFFKNFPEEEYGTCMLNIDASRVGNGCDRAAGGPSGGLNSYGGGLGQGFPRPEGGRFPSNTLWSHVPGPNGCVRVGSRRVKSGDSKASESTPSTVKGGIGGKISRHYADPDGLEEVPEYICARDEDGDYICPVALLDEQSGVRKSGERKPVLHATDRAVYGQHKASGLNHFESSEGGASRFFQQFHDPHPGFFYAPKASRAERNKGLEEMPEKPSGVMQDDNYQWRVVDTRPGRVPHDAPKAKAANTHPCVKPLSLMRYLLKLVTPPNGTTLDPFAGSGTTGVAALSEGFNAILIEAEPEYAEIAERRCAHALRERVEPKPVEPESSTLF